MKLSGLSLPFLFLLASLFICIGPSYSKVRKKVKIQGQFGSHQLHFFQTHQSQLSFMNKIWTLFTMFRFSETRVQQNYHSFHNLVLINDRKWMNDLGKKKWGQLSDSSLKFWPQSWQKKNVPKMRDFIEPLCFTFLFSFMPLTIFFKSILYNLFANPSGFWNIVSFLIKKWSPEQSKERKLKYFSFDSNISIGETMCVCLEMALNRSC